MTTEATPGALGSNEGLGAGAEARCCTHCDDGDGHCVFPYYGAAPHTHSEGPVIGSTRVLPREQWEANFREDPDCPMQGVYMRCPECGRGEPEAPNVEAKRATPEKD